MVSGEKVGHLNKAGLKSSKSISIQTTAKKWHWSLELASNNVMKKDLDII